MKIRSYTYDVYVQKVIKGPYQARLVVCMFLCVTSVNMEEIAKLQNSPSNDKVATAAVYRLCRLQMRELVAVADAVSQSMFQLMLLRE